MRKVVGYNLFMMGSSPLNLAKILVGSEGTLGFFTKIKLQLHRIPKHKVQAVCHFDRFYDSMEMTRHIVELGPSAVELLDRTMLDLAHAIPAFRSTIDRIVRGRPAALLFVEFAGEDHAALLEDRKSTRLNSSHGYISYAVFCLKKKKHDTVVLRELTYTMCLAL